MSCLHSKFMEAEHIVVSRLIRVHTIIVLVGSCPLPRYLADCLQQVSAAAGPRRGGSLCQKHGLIVNGAKSW